MIDRIIEIVKFQGNKFQIIEEKDTNKKIEIEDKEFNVDRLKAK